MFIPARNQKSKVGLKFSNPQLLHKSRQHQQPPLRFFLSLGFVGLFCLPCKALPPSNDIPEEILRTEVITAARSSFDGQEVTAWQYSIQTERLQISPYSPQLEPKIRSLIFLLQLRGFFKTFLFPF